MERKKEGHEGRDRERDAEGVGESGLCKGSKNSKYIIS